MKTIHLDPSQVPVQLRGNYNGKKFKAVVTETVTIPAEAGMWDGGSRELFHAIDLRSGQRVNFPGQDLGPASARQERKINLIPGFAVIKETMFQGTDLGITYYVHPTNAVTLLPEIVALVPFEQLVLEATRSFKASYGGKNRYQLAKERWEWSGRKGEFPDVGEWEAVRAELIKKGLLNKAGAITIKGRNAIA